jgi:uncharacterized repeat protein (TIGR01451 family)
MLRNRLTMLLLSGTAAVACAGAAQAQSASTGTAAGTTISNTASVSYTVNGTAQTTNSTTASFVVDRKVNFSVVRDQAGATSVNVAQTGAVIAFKVTNTTNGTQDFLLDPTQQNIVAGILTGTSDFTMLNLKAYVDSNGNGVYDPGVDTQTYIDELAPNASVEVFLVGDVPNSSNANLAFAALHVTAAAGGAPGTQGAALVATDLNLANADNTVDVVFADDDDDGLGIDTARNGQGWAYGQYQVSIRNVALTVTKTALVLSDGVNTLNPKSLPGATVQYCLLANNATLTTAANNVTLIDVVPANTTYVAGSITTGLPGGTCVLAGTPISDATGFNPTTKTVTANIGTLAGGASTAVAFKVTIN